MEEFSKSRWPKKITACGFILAILSGNFIFLQLALSSEAHPAFEYAFIVGFVTILAGGLALTAQKVVRWLSEPPP